MWRSVKTTLSVCGMLMVGMVPYDQEKRIKRKANRWGHHAETLTCWWLRCQGYRILGRRFKTHMGEVDIIARRGAMVIFVEVKARRRLDHLDVVSVYQQRRITKAAYFYLAKHPELVDATWRFDVVIIRPWRFPMMITQAWESESW